jgi:hypothetical protein
MWNNLLSGLCPIVIRKNRSKNIWLIWSKNIITYINFSLSFIIKVSGSILINWILDDWAKKLPCLCYPTANRRNEKDRKQDAMLASSVWGWNIDPKLHKIIRYRVCKSWIPKTTQNYTIRWISMNMKIDAVK